MPAQFFQSSPRLVSFCFPSWKIDGSVFSWLSSRGASRCTCHVSCRQGSYSTHTNRVVTCEDCTSCSTASLHRCLFGSSTTSDVVDVLVRGQEIDSSIGGQVRRKWSGGARSSREVKQIIKERAPEMHPQVLHGSVLSEIQVKLTSGHSPHPAFPRCSAKFPEAGAGDVARTGDDIKV